MRGLKHVRRTVVGENHLSKDKNTDIAAALNERYKQNGAQKTGNFVEGDIFAHVHQPAEDKIVTESGQGADKWKAFCKLLIGDAEKSLVSRISFVGMKNDRFCVECSDDDFEMIRKLGIEDKAKEFFGCKGSFAPAFYRN